MILKSLLDCRRNSFVTESDIICIRQLYRCFIFLVVLTLNSFTRKINLIRSSAAVSAEAKKTSQYWKRSSLARSTKTLLNVKKNNYTQMYWCFSPTWTNITLNKSFTIKCIEKKLSVYSLAPFCQWETQIDTEYR